MTARPGALLSEVIDLEWEMLRAARTAQPAAGPEEQRTFRLMRWMTHSVLTEELLAWLLGHLERAKAEGRNLMTEKYARMGGQIPPLSDSPFIGRIADLEQTWMDAVQRRYPLTFPGAGGPFRQSLTAELETYPEDYLEAHFAFEAACKAAGRNLVEERFELLFLQLGHESIEAREHQALLDSRKCGCS